MLDKKITDSFVFRQGEPQYISRISRYGARGILLNAKKQVALMYMRNKGLYKLPGGGIDENETKERLLQEK
jgi:8-oxo-dGTP diphosphatase